MFMKVRDCHFISFLPNKKIDSLVFRKRAPLEWEKNIMKYWVVACV